MRAKYCARKTIRKFVYDTEQQNDVRKNVYDAEQRNDEKLQCTVQIAQNGAENKNDAENIHDGVNYNDAGRANAAHNLTNDAKLHETHRSECAK